jgi:Cu2+-exporting ATPase
LDDPAWTSRHVQEQEEVAGRRLQQTILAIEGLRCGACAWLIERVLLGTEGVAQVQANAVTARLRLAWDPSVTSLKVLTNKLLVYGYAAVPIGATGLEARRREEERQQNRRLFVAGLGWAQVMMLAMPEYVGAGPIEAEYLDLLRGASLLITLPVLLYSGAPFVRSALSVLGHRRLNMDVPISLGLWLAFIGSVVGLFTQAPHVYFESVTMFLFLVLMARQLEARIRRRTLRRREQMALDPPALAYRLAPRAETLPPWRLAIGDKIRVPSGERFPADGRLDSDSADIDLSSLTGELRPVTRRRGEICPEGAINLGAEAQAEVVSDSASGSLARLTQLAESAAAQRPRWTDWADAIAARFTAGVLVVAVLSLIWGLIDGQSFMDWLPRIVAILVVSCPCALSVAGPSAYAASLARLLERGVAISEPDTLEKAWQLTHLVFDKTGTLTEPQASSVKPLWMAPFEMTPVEAWGLIAALTATSHHPLARAMALAADGAITRAQTEGHARAPVLPARLEGTVQRAGLGLEAVVDGQAVRLGSASFVGLSGSRPIDSALGAATLFLSRGGVVVAAFWLADALRPEAAGLLRAARERGITPWIFSGDDPARVWAVADTLGIPHDRALGGLSPEEKKARLTALQASGARVAMVGDGVNDAPVLAQADLSFAVMGSAPLAQQRADAYLLAPGLTGVESFLSLASRTRRILRQNVAWAIGYNLFAIPFAAVGLVPPVWAAIGMAASSLLVMANAARLMKG